MSNRPKPRKKVTSLWGDVARMEAEVRDPEEVETSVFDMDRIAELRKEAEELLAQKRQLAAEQAGEPPPGRYDDEEDDATSVFDSGPLMAAARRKLANAVTEVAAPLDDEPPEVHTEIYSRKPLAEDDDTPSIVVSEASLDDDLADVLSSSDSADEVSVDEPASEPAASPPVSRPSAAAHLVASQPNVFAAYGPFVLLVVVGFLVGYLAVSYL